MAFGDASVSTQFLVGKSYYNGFDLSGTGRSYGGGIGPIAGTLSQGLNAKGGVTNTIIGVGPSAGVKYTAGGSQTITSTIKVFVPMLLNPVRLKFN